MRNPTCPLIDDDRRLQKHELETGFDVPLDGYENPQSNKYFVMTFQVDRVSQRSS